ncbi:MAG TPA: OmpH family outer membrane protein [Petrotogaceae bacterium]|nr:OmpH family outer membrane protein [Petrotogaceae bacterium]HNV05633.1 OmpH family outer membrane protein [Petrotogaceae bacterium]HPG48320.1 OmpH family outer membrane protein [Petrotogaceae bacterium]HPO26352.1 OmpH family outer membrane protein [Petrotogaceae bacterium]HPX16749.1 OmpH family outer membrane protein [Petrotogaceae bacterium]
MKKTLFFSLAAILVVFAVISFAAANNTQTVKIAFVDIEKVTENSIKWKDMEDKYKNDLQYYQSKIDKDQADLKKLQDSKAATDVLQKKYQDIQTKAQEYMTALQNEYTAKTNALLTEIKTKITEYAQTNGYDLVLFEQSVVYASKNVDITESVITLVNK